ncbi:MAG: beta-ketoacyl-ACP synthase II [Bacteroidales bacterium]|nr:beta-ketoacyl-ACP synthase II [Bacteroidales bacterium]
MQFKRVVVTGIGTVNPLGNNVADFFAALDEGKSVASPITRFECSLFKTRFACQVSDFDMTAHGFTVKEAKINDRYSQLALVAAQEAVADCGMDLEKVNKDRIGVVVSSGVGGLESTLTEAEDYVPAEGPRYSPFLIPKIITDIAAGHISIKYGFRGPNFALTAACSTSAVSIAIGAQLIQTGKADAMVVGGAEAPIWDAGVGGFNSMRALSTRNDEPQKASRPFDKGRDGFVMAEGAGVLMLEEYDHAVARGARIYAELIGVGLSGDAYHFTAPDPNGVGAAMCMKLALEDAGIAPADVDYINTHGTSTHHGDIAEVRAIKEVFGSQAGNIAITSTKSMTGHLLGAAGAVEAIACIHSLRDGIIPPTINFEEEDPDIDYSLGFVFNKAAHRKVNIAMSNSFGFGGHNACLILKNL